MDMTPKPSCCSVGRSAGEEPTILEPPTSIPAHQVNASIDGMVYLSGGTFLMGTDDPEGFKADGEGPVREVEVSPFYIDSCAVSNAEFAEFVRITGYQTEAERYGWSYVFHLFVPEDIRRADARVVPGIPWWLGVDGASWNRPEGVGSTVDDRMDHPVVHISWNDAVRYCNWSGKRLLTEAEWEYAARGGLVQKRYPWGDLLKPNGEHRCNIWQGKFPEKNHASDGYIGTAPVQSFPPNDYGLYNIVGNVWEWCSDWFNTSHPAHIKARDPRGPNTGTNRVMRGGSYLCHKSYCNRYRVAARSSNTPDSSTGNLGFRCAADA
jgi:sulfatase modifying factor 1